MTLKPELSSELRSMVRDILREVVPAKTNLAAVESVRITTDADLAAFVARLMESSTQERVKAGRLRFTLGATPQATVPAGTVLTGVISEKKINKYASLGTLVLAADAVLTPLARDRARKLGLAIERKR